MLASGERRTHHLQAPPPTKLLQSRRLLGAGAGAVVGGSISASRMSGALLLRKLAVPTHLRAAPELKDRRRPTNPLAPPGLLHQRPPAVVAAMAVLGRSLTARLEGWLKADPPVTHLNAGLVMWHLRLFLISSA